MLGGAGLLTGGTAATGGLSKEFFDLVKGIGESRSKQEEDRIIFNEVTLLKARMQEPCATKAKIKEYLVRALYAEMLGHDASFAHIHAVKLASDKNIMCKRTGYMLCGLSLKPQDELILLLVNTIQKDLASSDYLEVCAALNCCCQVVHAEAIPVVLPSIINLLAHTKEMVRKKALCALLGLFQVCPSILPSIQAHVKRAIFETDPSVISAALDLIEEIFRRRGNDPACAAFVAQFDGLVPTLNSILKDVTNLKLSRDWDFHRVPAPWLQIKLLNFMALVAGNDQRQSEECYEVLRSIISRTDLQVNVSYAIAFECIKTISSIYPQPALCELAASAVSRFIQSDNKNLQHAGITGLAQLVQIDVSYVEKHEMAIIDFLDDKDETLRLKALDLLAQTTNVSNVTAVVEKILNSAEYYVEASSKRSLVAKAIDLTEKYSPDPTWYLQIVSKTMIEFGEFLPAETGNEFLRLVAEGPTGDSEKDASFRSQAVIAMVRVAEHSLKSLAESTLRTSFWILGTYGFDHRPESLAEIEIFDLLMEGVTMQRAFTERNTRACLLSALLKFAAALICERPFTAAAPPPSWFLELKTVLISLMNGEWEWDSELAQRSAEFLAVLEKHPSKLKSLYLLPHTSSCGSRPSRPSLSVSDYLENIENCVAALNIKSRQTKPPQPSRKVEVPRRSTNERAIKPSLKYKPYRDHIEQPVQRVAAQVSIIGIEGGAKSPPSEMPNSSSLEPEFRIGTGRWQIDGLRQDDFSLQTSPSHNKVLRSSPMRATGIEMGRDAVVMDGRLEEKRKAAVSLFAGIGKPKAAMSAQDEPQPISSSVSSVTARDGIRVTSGSSIHPRYDLLELSDDEDIAILGCEVPPPNHSGEIELESERTLDIGVDEHSASALLSAETPMILLSDEKLGITGDSKPLGGPSKSAAGTLTPLRPLRLTIEEMATQWESLCTEVKRLTRDKVGWSAAEVLCLFEEYPWHFRVIQVIGNEGLSAAASSDGARIFLYCRVDGGVVDLTLRSEVPEPACLQLIDEMMTDLNRHVLT